MRYSILIILAALFLVACGKQAVDEPEISPIEAIANDYLEEMLERFPSMETSYSLPGAAHDDIFDNSPDARLAWNAKVDAWLAELARIGAPTDIGSRDWVTYGILYEELASSVATRGCRSELWAASTSTAWHTDMPFVFDLQPLGSPETRAAALQRLGKVAHTSIPR